MIFLEKVFMVVNMVKTQNDSLFFQCPILCSS